MGFHLIYFNVYMCVKIGQSWTVPFSTFGVLEMDRLDARHLQSDRHSVLSVMFQKDAEVIFQANERGVPSATA